MNIKKCLFYLLACLLGGCVPVMSLNSLFTTENLVFEEKLLGTWVDDCNDPNNTWQFNSIGEEKPMFLSPVLEKNRDKVYKLMVSDDDGEKGLFIGCLVKLDNKLFLDVFPSQFPCSEENIEKMGLQFNAFFFWPVHTFLIIDSIEPQLKMRITDDGKFKELLEAEPNAVRHTIGEDNILITASTKELQAFVLKYADDDRVFTSEGATALVRCHSSTDTRSSEPNKTKP
jgi:hypothetical protein